jgi:branched-chain amino acid transport system permease protein
MAANRRAANWLLTLVVWVALAGLPYWLNLLGSYTSLGTQVLAIGLAAMSLNFLLGFTGVLSFGHAAYFGLGAYGAGMTIKYLVPNTILGIVVGVAAGAVAAALIGFLIRKLRGVYFAMVTIAFGQVFFFVAYRWNTATGGDDGLSGWQRLPVDFGFAKIDIAGNETLFYYFVLFWFALAVLAMWLLLRSPFGHTLVAIRENERRTRFLGVPIEQHIWLSFIISGSLTSLAGALFGLLNNFADPHWLRWDQSGIFVIMVVLGGMRAFWGPLIGAAIVVVLQDVISGDYVTHLIANAGLCGQDGSCLSWESFIGLFFVLVVLFFPRGVLGILGRRALP